jgi:hypothetical protein
MSILNSIFSSGPKPHIVLVFDIGSSSVGGALVQINPKGIPKILFSAREPILLEVETSFDRFLNLTLGSIEKVSAKISKAGLGSPKKIYCTLSSPWYASQTRIITLEKEAPFVFGQKLHDDLIAKEVGLFQEEYLTKYGHPNEKVRQLEVKTISIKLNGYYREDALDQKAESLEMTIFASISPEQVLEKIGDAISKHFHKKGIRFMSFGMASFVVTRDVSAQNQDFLLIDLGGEVTDISMVKKNVLRESISFPLGTNFMVRGIALGLNCTLEEGRSFLALYKDGHAVGSLAKSLDPLVTDLKNIWLKKFQESLAGLSNDISIPSQIFLAVDGEYGEFFRDIIKTEQFNQYTLTESKFNVTFLALEELNNAVTFAQSAERDPFIIISSIYINRHFN